MADLLEPWEADEAWLRRYRYLATEDERDRFCERVAILVAEGVAERPARYQALREIKQRDVEDLPF